MLGRSRGGFSTKIHLRTNAKGDLLTFDVTGGEAHEVKGYDALMKLHDVDPDRLLGDKGYDSDDIRHDLVERGIEPVIPPRSNRKTQIEIRSRSIQARQSHRALRQPSQAVSSHRDPLRENRQSLPLDAVHRSSKALDENCQHGLATACQIEFRRIHLIPADPQAPPSSSDL